MSTVNASVTLKKQAVSANSHPAAWLRFQLMQGTTVAYTSMVALPAVSASFSNVVDGEYTIEAQRLDLGNAPIGDAATSAPFTVVNMVEIDVPDAITLTFS